MGIFETIISEMIEYFIKGQKAEESRKMEIEGKIMHLSDLLYIFVFDEIIVKLIDSIYGPLILKLFR